MPTQTALPLVIVSHELPPDWLAPLHGRCRLVIGPSTAEFSGLAPRLRPYLPEAAGLFSLLTVQVDESLLDAAPNLRIVSNMAVGVDNVDLAACRRRGIPVGHTPGVLTDSTADLTLALLLSLARHLPQAAADARAGKWTTWLPEGWLGLELNDATLGIVGMGQIGQAVAHRARAFGMRLLYTGPARKPEVEIELAAQHVPLPQLLQQSDVVSLHAPLTPETRNLINMNALEHMKSSAILINMARGPLVDSAALFVALQNGTIAAAGLDVTDPEPLTPTHPLYTLPNCLIVPHIGSATHRARRRMAELACKNLLAGLAGQPLPHQAN